MLLLFIFAEALTAFAAFATALAAMFTALAAALRAAFADVIELRFAFAFALALFVAESPQAMPSAPITRTAVRAITFFISLRSPVFSKIKPKLLTEEQCIHSPCSRSFIIGTHANIVATRD